MQTRTTVLTIAAWLKLNQFIGAVMFLNSLRDSENTDSLQLLLATLYIEKFYAAIFKYFASLTENMALANLHSFDKFIAIKLLMLEENRDVVHEYASEIAEEIENNPTILTRLADKISEIPAFIYQHLFTTKSAAETKHNSEANRTRFFQLPHMTLSKNSRDDSVINDRPQQNRLATKYSR
jgi:hypothetical protein